MNRPMVRIYTGGGEFIDREMNDAEYAQFEIDVEENKIRKAEAKAKATAKAALLDRLGITAEEATLLLS